MNAIILSLLFFLFVPIVRSQCTTRLSSLCSCEAATRGTILQCDKTTNLTNLIESLENERVRIHRLQIRNLQQDSIGDNAFKSLIVRQIDLSNNHGLKNISSLAFSGQSEWLEEIVLSNCSLSAVPKLDKLPNLAKLDLSNNLPLSSVPDAVFVGSPNLRELRLRGCSVCQMNPTALNEVRESLELLDLSSNCLTAAPANTLRGHNKLMLLDLSDNRINDLPNMQFMNMPLLREVRLNRNEIREFRAMTFMNVPELSIINLAENQLSSLEGNRFQAFTKLEMLNLSRNAFTSLPATSFSDMSALKQLFLDNNMIESMQTLSFSNCPRLELVSLQRNGLKSISRNAFESLSHLSVLQLSENNLTSITRGMLDGVPNLTQLHLRRNRLVQLEEESFTAISNLTTLDMAENQLADIPLNTLSKLQKLFLLDLSGNQLHSFKEGCFPRKVATLLIHDNPLLCDKEIEWFVKYLVSNNVRTFLPEQNDVVCVAPEEMKGTRLKDLMIKRAEASFNNTMKAMGMGSAAVQGDAAQQLLPMIMAVPEVQRMLAGGGVAPGSGILANLGRVYHESGLPGASFIPDGLGQAAGAKSAELIDPLSTNLLGSKPIVDPSKALKDIARPLSRLASGYAPQAADINELLSSVPQLAMAAPTDFSVNQLSPELIRHILRGGQIPGVPKPTLDTLVINYLRQMVRAAQMASQGISNEFTMKMLPPLSELPVEFLQQVTNGENLPGLSTNETETIKRYYLHPVNNNQGAVPIQQPSVSTPLAPGVIAGLPTDVIISRLPKGFDLTRLPPAVIKQFSTGGAIDISQLPEDMLAAFREHNPDLSSAIDDALARARSGPSAAPSPASTATPRRASPNDVIIPYDIGEIDKAGDLHLKNEKSSESIMLWTGIGLAAVFTVSVLTIAYMVYRRKRALKKRQARAPGESQDRDRFMGFSNNNEDTSSSFKAHYALPTNVNRPNPFITKSSKQPLGAADAEKCKTPVIVANTALNHKACRLDQTLATIHETPNESPFRASSAPQPLPMSHYVRQMQQQNQSGIAFVSPPVPTSRQSRGIV